MNEYVQQILRELVGDGRAVPEAFASDGFHYAKTIEAVDAIAAALEAAYDIGVVQGMMLKNNNAKSKD